MKVRRFQVWLTRPLFIQCRMMTYLAIAVAMMIPYSETTMMNMLIALVSTLALLVCGDINFCLVVAGIASLNDRARRKCQDEQKDGQETQESS